MKEYYIDELNCRMRYCDFPGDDTPILFFHGLGCAGSFDYSQVAAQRALAGHRRILVDLLGSGYSDKPENFDYSVSSHVSYLKSFIDRLDINELILFGHSMGGPVAIETAKLFKNHVRTLVLSESNLDPSKEGAGSYQIAQFCEEEFVTRKFTQLITENKLNGNTMWAATLSNCSPHAIYRLSKNALLGGNPSWRALLYELPVQKGFIFGEKSLPDEDYEELQRHNIHVEIVPDAGHSMAWENPKGLAIAISNCLK